MSTLKTPMPALIGHRGLPSLAPENTAASLRTAAENNIEWVEIDVTMAGDGSLVVMHDTNLKLFGLPDVELKNIDEAYLKQVDAGSWFHKNFAGEKLLFLSDLLQLTALLNLSLNLEIKINPAFEHHAQVNAVFNALEAANRINDKLIVSSFDHKALMALRELSADVQIGVLFEELPSDLLTHVLPMKPVSIHCDQSKLTEAQTLAFKSSYPLYCYTVNDTDTFAKLLRWGVSGVFCDRAHAADMRAVAG